MRSDDRVCGTCDGTGRVCLSDDHQQTLDAVRVLQLGHRGAPTTSEIRVALGGVEGAPSALNQRLAALASWGLVARVGRRAGSVTWRAVESLPACAVDETVSPPASPRPGGRG